ncbi:hypothetical protein [Hymenobacter convexus]|uniref:hypothetical protein n=1 Tax=Hymenobacter sp. CA1UV-4 TaxID=3063782 RepID=UPI0027125F98|nr:hypothetical protein [Hymenobacter sp. CA1UV-4]MDO7852095.1 hypothetical protein [Hymenobacter sp. CA1UV-4]
MTCHEFAHQIATTAPGYSDLLALGLKDASAARMIAEYQVHPRAAELQVQFPINDEINYLINTYDVSNLKIGMVEFMDVPVNHGNFLHFAIVELDLMLLSITGEVLVVDWQQFDHIMWRCAVDGEHFFEAMVIISQFLTLTMLDDANYNNEKLALSVADSAAKAAGSAAYLSFYQMLLGV